VAEVLLTIDIPDDVMEGLKIRAACEVRAPEDQALWMIKCSLGMRQVSPDATLLSETLRSLWLRKGGTSTRKLARRIGEVTGEPVSHTTVSVALAGRRVVSWPVIERMVKVLGGDIEEFRALWMEAQK